MVSSREVCVKRDLSQSQKRPINESKEWRLQGRWSRACVASATTTHLASMTSCVSDIPMNVPILDIPMDVPISLPYKHTLPPDSACVCAFARACDSRVTEQSA